jgi:AraC family transcriptional regulator
MNEAADAMKANGKHDVDGVFVEAHDREVMNSQTDTVEEYAPTSAWLASSAGLGWSTVSAKLRSHAVGEAPPGNVLQDVEICLVVSGNDDGVVRRTGAETHQQAGPRLSPAGVGDNEIAIAAPTPQTLHLYLPAALLDQLKDDFNLSVVAPAHSIRHVTDIRDEVVQHIGFSILSELTSETAASRVYVKAASLTLAARLLQKYFHGEARTPIESSPHGFDPVRLRRVLEHISGNIGDNIALADLAEIAGYSPFHFARKFTRAMGVPPHRYVSRMRLEKAKAELAAGKLPIAEVALNAHFCSQASFTRAFHRAIGVTPKEYQRQRL